MISNKLRLYWHTLRHLKKKQLLYYSIRRGLKLPRRMPLPRDSKIRAGFQLLPPAPSRVSYLTGVRFEFLNRTVEFGRSVDWDSSDLPALWRYNLHYFDYLRQEGIAPEEGNQLIDDWIFQNLDPSGIGWHAYPVSLRLINWIFFLAAGSGTMGIERRHLTSLSVQAAWLEKNIEYHILANHLFENIKALLFAGALLGGVDGDRLLAKGLRLLHIQLGEQFLSDGGHYERSPMYHAILTQDLIDLCNLAVNNPAIFPSNEVATLKTQSRDALDYIYRINPPTCSVTFFNDSAAGIALDFRELEQYASRIFGYSVPERETGLQISSLEASGYYVIREDKNFLMIDCGEIGPDYQPGHAHCDTLSYEYYLAGRKVITNCGNFDYEASGERQFARSTAAHNTVVVDGAEQSEIWGAFRVARRARPIRAALTLVDVGHARFSGAHDGYQRLQHGVVHNRTVNYFSGGAFRVEDTIAAEGIHRVDSYVHFVAGLRIKPIEDGFVVSDERDKTVLKLIPFGADAVEIVASERFPEFGLRQRAMSLRILKSGTAPFSFGYEVRV